jgi:hypothetical protein
MNMNSDEMRGTSRNEDGNPPVQPPGDASSPGGGATDLAARSERERKFARRALIQAGWSVPVITGLVFRRSSSGTLRQPRALAVVFGRLISRRIAGKRSSRKPIIPPKMRRVRQKKKKIDKNFVVKQLVGA